MQLFFSALFIIISIFSQAQIGIIDPTFNVGTGSNNFVYHVTIQPDQKIIASGNFTTFNGVNRKYIVRLNSDGSVDLTFNPQISNNISISKSIVQNDGKIIVFGRNQLLNGAISGYIVRLNQDGSLDNSFIVNNEFGYVLDIQLLPDNKILIAGIFSTTGIPTRNFRKLNIDGTFDTSFNASAVGPNNFVDTVFLLPNNKILIGGGFTKYNNIDINGIARINEDGSLDETFNPGTGNNSTIFSINQQPDGKLLIGGFFTTYDGISRNSVARINDNGSLDPTFNPISGSNDGVSYIKMQSSGKILVTGAFTIFNDVVKKYAVLLNTDGSLVDNIANTSFDNAVNLCVKQNDGKLVCGGYFSNYGGVPSKGVVRIIPNDLLATTSFSENNIQLTPNPTTDFINIKTTKRDIENVFIHDLAGKLIYTGKSMKINVANFPSATYIISIKTPEGLKSFKFIKI